MPTSFPILPPTPWLLRSRIKVLDRSIRAQERERQLVSLRLEHLGAKRAQGRSP